MTRLRQVLATTILHPGTWIVLAALITCLDFLAGPWIHIASFYSILVVLAAWSHRFRWALFMAVVLPWMRPLLFAHSDPAYWFSTLVINAAIRSAGFSGLALLTRELTALATRVGQLEQLLPMCAWCRRIRVEGDSWVPLEDYLIRSTHGAVTHGICPECRAALMLEQAP